LIAKPNLRGAGTSPLLSAVPRGNFFLPLLWRAFGEDSRFLSKNLNGISLLWDNSGESWK
jgi:hypothetical protein